MANYSMKKLLKAITSIAIEEGSVLFVDRNMVDMLELAKAKFPVNTPEILIVGVDVPKDKTIHQTLLLMSKEELAELMKKD